MIRGGTKRKCHYGTKRGKNTYYLLNGKGFSLTQFLAVRISMKAHGIPEFCVFLRPNFQEYDI